MKFTGAAASACCMVYIASFSSGKHFGYFKEDG
jgi:hypothetical protein